MKLVIAIVHADDADACGDALSAAGVACTRLPTVGGFLGRENATLLAGVDEARVDEVVEILRRRARSRVEELQPLATGSEAIDLLTPYPVEVEVGGATIFVVPVERFEKV